MLYIVELLIPKIQQVEIYRSNGTVEVVQAPV
jgi:hypothetical protein